MNRESGYYWVRFNKDSELEVSHWNGAEWDQESHWTSQFEDSMWCEINETRIGEPL